MTDQPHNQPHPTFNQQNQRVGNQTNVAGDVNTGGGY
jgi:hypothetical protein